MEVPTLPVPAGQSPSHLQMVAQPRGVGPADNQRVVSQTDQTRIVDLVHIVIERVAPQLPQRPFVQPAEGDHRTGRAVVEQ